MKKTRLRKSDIRELNEKIACYNFQANKKDNVEIVDYGNLIIIFVNSKPLFFYHNERIIPTLKFLLENMAMKKVVVDMGAVKFVISGADIMRPGIVEIDEGIEEDEPIAVVDVNNKKPLSVGIAMFSSEEMSEKESGKAVKNIHYIGDKIWNQEFS
ncbi:MAG: DUF1947 domain-containing protein [Nanoarchaeota archaeon]|nr:DUF1947 domain-containing protein [Nanoarchaeota archaeon]MCK5629466.1 DUF1947 domain-containing protein [Nanoarchaeota archaeon]